MKKIFFFSLLCISFSMLLSSCSGDDEELPNLGNFTVDGATYQINKGNVKGYKSTTANQSNNYTFDFASEQGNTVRTVRLSISFPFNTMMNGEYKITGSSRQLDPWLSQYTETTGKHTDTYNNLITGVCTVARIGENNFKVKFQMQTTSGPEIKGEFEGDVKIQEIE